MGRIDELIERLCPDGVEYKALGEVGEFRRGTSFQKKHFAEEGIPCIHYGQLYTYYKLYASETKSFLGDEFADAKGIARTGDLIIATTSENAEDVCKAMAWLGEANVVVSNDAYIFRHSLNPKYVAYFFQSDWFQLAKKPFVTGTKVLRVSSANMSKIRIPVPPMEIQEEIVRVLDSFAELEAELEAELKAELEARKTQYAYYRDHLLSYKSLSEMAHGAVEVVEIGSCGNFFGGLSGKSKDDFTEGNARFVPYTNVYNNISVDLSKLSPVRVSDEERQHEIHQGDILITGSSETPDDCGMTSVVMDEPAEKVYLNSFCFGWRPNEEYAGKLKPGFLKFAMRALDIRRQVIKTANGVTRFNISKISFARVTIPVPPLDIQQQIVDVLDHFDSLTTSLAEGLSAEIEARRKQHAYYRDKLLAFKEKTA